MKCEHSTQYILLESSGELTPAQRARLDAHLARCPSCRSYRSALGHLRDETRADTTPVPRISVTAILVEAQRRTEQETAHRHAWFGMARHPYLAAAAAAVIAFTAGFSVVLLQSRPAAPVVASAPGVPGPVWGMDEWVDVRLDLLSDELSKTADELQTGLTFDTPPAAETLDEIVTRVLQMEV